MERPKPKKWPSVALSGAAATLPKQVEESVRLLEEDATAPRICWAATAWRVTGERTARAKYRPRTTARLRPWQWVGVAGGRFVAVVTWDQRQGAYLTYAMKQNLGWYSQPEKAREAVGEWIGDQAYPIIALFQAMADFASRKLEGRRKLSFVAIAGAQERIAAFNATHSAHGRLLTT